MSFLGAPLPSRIMTSNISYFSNLEDTCTGTGSIDRNPFTLLKQIKNPGWRVVQILSYGLHPTNTLYQGKFLS